SPTPRPPLPDCPERRRGNDSRRTTLEAIACGPRTSSPPEHHGGSHCLAVGRRRGRPVPGPGRPVGRPGLPAVGPPWPIDSSPGADMDLSWSDDEEAFRAEARAWLEENLAAWHDEHGGEAAIASGDTREGFAQHLGWERRLHAGRWAAVSWPAAYGG